MFWSATSLGSFWASQAGRNPPRLALLLLARPNAQSRKKKFVKCKPERPTAKVPIGTTSLLQR